MLWCKAVRSPHHHARIVSIDTSKAEAIPGVKEGTYRACILPPTDSDGRPKRLGIDPRLLSFDKSDLTCTVTPGRNEIIIKLDSPRR